MPEFDVRIIERLEKTVTVEAGNSEEAEAKARENWLEVKEGYVLSSSDFTEVDFEVLPAIFNEERE